MNKSNIYRPPTHTELLAELDKPYAKEWKAIVNEQGELVYSNSIIDMTITRKNPTDKEIHDALLAYP